MESRAFPTEPSIPGHAFGRSPVGWLLSFFFFPCGAVAVLIALLLHKGNINASDKDNKIPQSSEDLGPELGGRRALTQKEIKSFCARHLISKKDQKKFEDNGELHVGSCLMCFGTSRSKFMWLELPCKHRYHVTCLRESLEHDASRCRVASCNFDVKDAMYPSLNE